MLSEAGVDSSPDGWAEGSRIHVNGDIFGLHKDAHRLAARLKARRRSGKIKPEVSIRHDSTNKDVFEKLLCFFYVFFIFILYQF